MVACVILSWDHLLVLSLRNLVTSVARMVTYQIKAHLMSVLQAVLK